MERKNCWQGHPPAGTQRDVKEKAVYALLDELKIPYRGIDHKPLYTMKAAAEAEKQLQAEVCKNLFLTDGGQTVFYLLMLQKNKRFNARQIHQEAGLPLLHFASPGQMKSCLGLQPGAVTPMGLINDPEGTIQLLIDRDLLHYREIGFHPCVNTTTLAVHTTDFMDRILPALHHTPTLLTINNN
jgi:Ala-tRNA(Pro) deacylase